MTTTIVGLDGLQWYTAEIKDYISKQIKDAEKEVVVSAESFLQFPSIGDSSCIYVDTIENKVYRWDDANLKYFVVGSDYNDIEVIDGTGK